MATLPQSPITGKPALGICEVSRRGQPCSGIAYVRRGGLLRCEFHGFEYELADVHERYVSGEWPIDSLPASAAKRVLVERAKRASSRRLAEAQS